MKHCLTRETSNQIYRTFFGGAEFAIADSQPTRAAALNTRRRVLGSSRRGARSERKRKKKIKHVTSGPGDGILHGTRVKKQ